MRSRRSPCRGAEGAAVKDGQQQFWCAQACGIGKPSCAAPAPNQTLAAVQRPSSLSANARMPADARIHAYT